MRLAVYLGSDRVGELTASGDQVEFRLLEAYRALYPRPVLGQVFEDDLDQVQRSRIKLPPFFSNLLPEGLLKDLLAKQHGLRAESEPHLLALVGEDLPGAIRVLVDDAADDDLPSVTEPALDEADDVLKFSLAGMQLKLSALRGDRGLTIPAHGRGGDWIIKLPDPRWAGVPENEWSMMTIARSAGLDVAPVELIAIGDVRGLPPELGYAPATKALAVRRFDRVPQGRVHMEDFAQVLDVRATSQKAKYRSTNFETIGRIVGRVAPASAAEVVSRIVFNVIVGNGDAHIKNWSLLYPDRVHAVLSPAYDVLSTLLYLPNDDLGLNLAKSKRFEDVGMQSFVRLAGKAELDLDVREIVTGTIQRTMTAWRELRADLPIPEDALARIEAHWARVPLLA